MRSGLWLWGLRAVPTHQLIQLGIAERADRRAHQRYVARAIAVVIQRLAQVIQALARQIGRAGHLRHAGFTVAGRAQTKPHRLGRQIGGERWQGTGQTKCRDQYKSHREHTGIKATDSSSGHRYNSGLSHPSERTVPTTLLQSNLPGLELIHRGKVRDVYALSGNRLLIVATDRLSAFDVVLPDPIPGKGEMLTQISNFWFGKTAHIVPNHLLHTPLEDVLPPDMDVALYRKRAVVTKRLKPVPVEAIARGYLIGSGWKDYQATGSLCGIELPAGLRQAEQLPEPIFTPSTKAAVGDHDENVSFDAVIAAVGKDLAEQVRDATLAIYKWAAAYAAERGIIIADTKFEFGTDEDGKLYVMDEMLTPDSSRFWPADQYQVGISPPSYDKQFVRDYLETLDWNKKAPGPRVPADVIAGTSAKYAEALQRLAGITLD